MNYNPNQPPQQPGQPQQQPLYPYQQPPYPYQQQQPVIQFEQIRDYTAAAWLSAALSVFFFIPGLIAAIINLLEADNVRKRTGVAPQGYGCLWAVFLWCSLPILIGVFIFMLLAFSSIMH